MVLTNMSNIPNNTYLSYLPNKTSTTHLLFNLNDENEGGLTSVLNKIFNSSWWDTITIGDVTNAIVSLKAYPFIIDSVGSSTVTLNMLGKEVMTNVKAKPIDTLVSVFGDSFNVDGDSADFTDYNPFSGYFLYLPFVGYVELDPNDIVGKETFIKAYVDLTSGDLVYYIYSSTDNRMIMTKSANVSVDIPTQSQNKNINNLAWLKTISNLIETTAKTSISMGTAAGQIVTGNVAKGAQTAASAATGIVGGVFDLTWGVYDATRPNLTGAGEQGNLGWFTPTNIYLVKVKNEPCDTLEDLSKSYGRPLLKYQTDTERKSLQGRTKYRQCHISFDDMLDSEIAMLNDILTNGFTIE